MSEDGDGVGRRDVLEALGLLGVGAVAGGGATLAATEPAAASSHGTGELGTSADPLSKVHVTELTGGGQAIDVSDPLTLSARFVPKGAVVSSATTTSGHRVLGLDTSLGFGFTVTLASVDCVIGNGVILKDVASNASSGNVEIVTEGSEQIDGAASDSITTDGGHRHLIPDGDDWFSITSS